MSVTEFIRGLKIVRIEKKLTKYKEELLIAWRDELEDEYAKEIEDKDNEIFRLKKVIADERHNAEYWHGKYDALDKVYNGVKDNIIKKVEDNAMKVGEQKEQVKNLKKDLKEKTD